MFLCLFGGRSPRRIMFLCLFGGRSSRRSLVMVRKAVRVTSPRPRANQRTCCSFWPMIGRRAILRAKNRPVRESGEGGGVPPHPMNKGAARFGPQGKFESHHPPQEPQGLRAVSQSVNWRVWEIVDDHRAGKVVVILTGRWSKCGVISPRFGVQLKDLGKWQRNLLPSRQFRIQRRGLVARTSAEQSSGG